MLSKQQLGREETNTFYIDYKKGIVYNTLFQVKHKFELHY